VEPGTRFQNRSRPIPGPVPKILELIQPVPGSVSNNLDLAGPGLGPAKVDRVPGLLTPSLRCYNSSIYSFSLTVVGLV